MSTAGNVVHICEVGINPERVACNVKLSSWKSKQGKAENKALRKVE